VISALGHCSSAHRRHSSPVANKAQYPGASTSPNTPSLAPLDFILFPKVKEQLAGITLALNTFKITWERAIRIITAEKFAAVYRQWLEGNKKCVHIGGDYVQKS
jgi:hypothetical protein